MYESPINFVIQDVQNQITQDAERTILNVVGKCGVTVDKDELIKAIKYDRNQYTKGYKDGVNNTLDKIRAEIENHCGLVKENHCKYCSYCHNVMGIREILELIDKYSKEESVERHPTVEQCGNEYILHLPQESEEVDG